MKILIISNLFPPEFIGGYELAARDVARRLAEKGHEIYVLTSPMVGMSEDEPEKFTVSRSLYCATQTMEFSLNHELRIRGGIVCIFNLKILAGVLATFEPEAVICFNLAGLGPYPILISLVRLGLSPLVYMGDNMFGNGLDSREERENFLSFFDFQAIMNKVRLLPVSELIREEASAYLGFSLRREYVVPGWVDRALVAQEPTRRPDSTDITRFVFSSRIAPHKGIDVLLEACETLCERGYSNYVVDLFGAGEVAVTLQKIEIRTLQKAVRFGGSLAKTEMLDRFAGYDFLLFPTWEREPFGFVAAEAAYLGCPPIMTGGCGAAEWFRDQIDCLKIERNPDSLAEAMIYAIEMGPDERARLREATKATGRKCFDFDFWMDRIERTLHEARCNFPRGKIASVFNVITVQLRLWL